MMKPISQENSVEFNQILIVDDHPPFLEAMFNFLKDRNLCWKLDCAKSEKEALDQIASKAYSVIVVDFKLMPYGDGFRIADAARQLDQTTMIIMITGHPKDINKRTALSRGLFDFVVKGASSVSDEGDETLLEIEAVIKNALSIRELIKLKLREQDLLSAEARVSAARKVGFLGLCVDPKIVEYYETNPDLLTLKVHSSVVIFWDIRGFTMLSDKLSGTGLFLRRFLEQYFDAAAEIVNKHGGILDKFIGDGAMALFGTLNQRAEDSVVAAFTAAIELRERFARVMQNSAEAINSIAGVSVGLGCGIHYGPVMVGLFGATSNRFQYTALGRNVNLAQRLESKALGGEILVSKEAREQAGEDRFIYGGLKSVEMKGFTTPQAAYPLISQKN